MDEMSKSAKPWFSSASFTNHGSTQAPPHGAEAPQADYAEPPDDVGREIKHALARGGRALLLPEFVKELRRVLQEQEAVLGLIDSNPTWALPVLNRQYYAVRSTADVLGLKHLAKVASRAEVLANLLDTGILPLAQDHSRILVQTHSLLVDLVSHIAKRGSDKECYPITKTALWMYALLDPALSDYEPGATKPRSDLH